MKIMAVNAGSSSIKFQLIQMPEEKVICSGLVERIGLEKGIFNIKYNGKKESIECFIKDHSVGVELLFNQLIEKKIVSSISEIDGVGHRIVHGGEEFSDSVIIDDYVLEKAIELADLAPLHNPAGVIGVKAFQKALPNAIQVAVFDTAFHQTIQKDTFLYATPYEWYEKYGIRKYGMHGTSHMFVSRRCNEFLNLDQKNSKIVVCHIGNGASICAVKGGKSVDTSMGLTPLEGIPMGTRSGNIDPSIISYICQKENKQVQEVIDILNKKSGYLGVSGVSSDSRDLSQAIEEGNERAKLAYDIQAKRIVDYIGSYYFLMGGIDAIVFTAGIGENAGSVRELICKRLEFLGIKLTDEQINIKGEEKIISTPDSKIKVCVIPTNEEVMIARDVLRLSKGYNLN